MVSKKKKKSDSKPPSRPVKADISLMPALALRYQVLICTFLLVAAICILYPELVFQNQVMHAGDVEAAASFGNPILQEMRDKDIYPLWNPYLYAGMPSYESLSFTPYVYPLGMVTHVLVRYLRFPEFTWLLFHIFMLGIGVCMLLMERKIHFLVAAGAGVLMMWMPNHVAVGAHGHGSQAIAVGFIPFALLLWDRLWRGRGTVVSASLLVVVLGFQLLRAHLQISYYTLALLALHLLFFGVLQIRDAFRGVQESDSRPHVAFFGERPQWGQRKSAIANVIVAAALFAVIVLGALALSAVLFAPVHDYAQYSIRGASDSGGLDYDYATSWSLHPAEMLTFLIPFSFGFGTPAYHGHMPFTDYPNYVGFVVLLFAVVAAFLVKTRFVRFLLFIVVVTTLVAFGKHLPLLYNPLFRWLPFFDKFRVPVMILIVQQFALTLLFAVGVTAVLRCDPARGRRWALRGTIAGAVLLIVAVLTRDYWLNQYAASIAPKLKFVRSIAQQTEYARLVGGHLHGDLIKLTFMMVTVSTLCLLFFKGRFKAVVLVAVVIVVAAVDLLMVDRYILHPNALFPGGRPIIKEKSVQDQFLQEDGVISFLKQDTSMYRVFPITHLSTAAALTGDFRSTRYMNFGISSIGGYHPAKLAIYEEFMETMSRSLGAGNWSIIDMLNVKYLVLANPLPDNPLFNQVWEGTNYRGERRIVYQNPRALPRVFFVDQYRVAPGSDALTALGAGADASQIVLLERAPSVEPRSREGATATISSYGFNEIRIDASLASPAILVLSEIFYPAWKVFVDGNKGEIIRANHILRAVALPEGNHEVVFRYDSSLLNRSLVVSVATLGITMTVLLLSIVVSLRGGGTWKRSS